MSHGEHEAPAHCPYGDDAFPEAIHSGFFDPGLGVKRPARNAVTVVKTVRTVSGFVPFGTGVMNMPNPRKRTEINMTPPKAEMMMSQTLSLVF